MKTKVKFDKVILAVAPTKRGFLPMDEAKRQKDKFMSVIRSTLSENVEIIDIDDICENGIIFESEKIDEVVDKFKAAKVDGLFIPHCDFGEEECAAGIAMKMKIPTLLWGARDEVPNSDTIRGRDTQCGMFACSKVLRRYGVKFSYIWNCETESDDFKNGYDAFIRTISAIKAVKNLRIAKIGARPTPFMSVVANEGELSTRYGVTTVPISPNSVAKLADEIIEKNSSDFNAYLEDLKSRMDTSTMKEEDIIRCAAIKCAMKELILKNKCQTAAVECWSASPILKAPVCMALGELSDDGIPASCETDLNGAVSMAILRAITLGEEATFLADLTIRHPENDNAELLWHCGPFPYSLKDEKSKARLIDGQERWELKKGEITVARFDEVDGEHFLFAGEGKGVDGPETTGTYVWFEVDNWKKWEEKLMFGPYIHHIGGVYGNYKKVLREVARYLGMTFDDPDVQGTYSL